MFIKVISIIATFGLSACLGYSAMALADVPTVQLDKAERPEASEPFYIHIELSPRPIERVEAIFDDLVEEALAESAAAQWYEPVTYYYSGSYSGNDFKSAGVVYGDDGTRYTWYSQNVLPGGGLHELNANGRHVNDNGYICDADGYIAVASSDHEMGTVINTPFGEAKVYDTGCDSGTVDVYTDF